MKSLKARALVYGLVILLGLLAALPNLLPAQAVAKLPAWYTSTTISLGLDLQGGSHLLLAADTAELFDAETRAIAEELGPKLVAAGVTGVRPKAESGAVVVMAKKPEQLQAAATVARALARDNSNGIPRFDVATEGGQLKLTLSESRIAALTNDALERSLEVVHQRLDESGLVEPSITRQGSDAIAMGLSTGLLGAALVFAFMLGLYGRWGAIACVGLAVNVGLVFGVLSVLGATLTLPGIAGIILTIGMAVDANILINERIREETRNGLSAPMAVRQGFSRAYSTILDSNVTTLIAISLL